MTSTVQRTWWYLTFIVILNIACRSVSISAAPVVYSNDIFLQSQPTILEDSEIKDHADNNTEKGFLNNNYQIKENVLKTAEENIEFLKAVAGDCKDLKLDTVLNNDNADFNISDDFVPINKVNHFYISFQSNSWNDYNLLDKDANNTNGNGNLTVINIAGISEDILELKEKIQRHGEGHEQCIVVYFYVFKNTTSHYLGHLITDLNILQERLSSNQSFICVDKVNNDDDWCFDYLNKSTKNYENYIKMVNSKTKENHRQIEQFYTNKELVGDAFHENYIDSDYNIQIDKNQTLGIDSTIISNKPKSTKSGSLNDLNDAVLHTPMQQHQFENKLQSKDKIKNNNGYLLPKSNHVGDFPYHAQKNQSDHKIEYVPIPTNKTLNKTELYSKPAPVPPGVIYFRNNLRHTVPSSKLKNYITTKGIYESPNAFEPVSGNTVQDSSNLFTDQIGSDSSIQMYQHPSHLTTTKQQYTPSDNTKYDKNFGKLTKYFQIPSRGIPYLSVTAKNNNILPLNKNLNVDTDRSTFLTDVPGTYKNIDVCDRNTNKKTQVNYNVPTVDKIPNTRYLSRDDSPNFFIENKLNVLEPTSTTLVGKRLCESTVEDTSPKQKDYIDCTNNNIRNELLTSLYPPGVISKPFSVEITKPTGPPITNAHKSLDDMNPIYNGHYDSRGGYHSDALPSSQVIQRNNIRNDVCKNENLSGKYNKVPSNLDVARANDIEGAIIYNEQMAESNQDGRLPDKYLFENKINSMKRPYLSAGKTYECKTTPEYSHNYSKPAPVSPGVINFRKNSPHTVPSSNFKSYITTKGIYESPNAFEPVSGNTVQDSSNLFTDQIGSDSSIQMYQHPSHLTTTKQQYTPSDNTKYDKNFGKLTKYFQIPSRGIPYLSVTAKNNNILPLNKNLNVDTDRSTFLTDVPGTYKNIDVCDRNTIKKIQVNYNVPTVDKIPNTRYLSRDDSPNFFIENKLNVLEPTSTTLVGKRLFESTVEDTSPKQKDYIDCTNNNIRNELLTSLYPPGVISKPFSVEITKPTGPPITNAHKSLDDMNPIYNGHYDSRGGYHSDALPSSQVIQRNNIRNDVCKNENLSGKYNKVPSNLDVARANDIEGAIIYNEQMAESNQDGRLPDKYLFENKINSMKRPYLSAGKTYECKTTPEYSHNYSKPAPVSPGVINFRKNSPHTVPSSNFKSYITTKGIYESPNAFEPVSGNTVQDSSNLFTDQIGSDSSIQMYQHPSHLTTTKQQYTPSDNTKYDKNFGKLTKYFQIPSRGIPYLSVTAKNNNILPLNKNLNVDTDRSTFLTDVPGTYKNIDVCDRNTNKKTQVNYNVPTVDKIPNTRYLSRDDSPNFFIENKLNVLEPTSTTLVGKRLFESTVEDTSPKQKDYIDCTNNNIRNELLTSIYRPGVISKLFSKEITKPTGPPITNAHKSLDDMNPIYNGHYDSRGGYHSDALPSSQVIQRNNIRNDVCKNENLSGKYNKVPSNLDVARANDIEGAIIYNEQMAESNQDVRLPDKYLFENKINSMKRPYLSAGKTYECKTTPEYSHNYSKPAPVSPGVIYFRKNPPHTVPSSNFKSYITTKGIYESPNAFEPVSGNTVQDSSNLFTDQIGSDSSIQMYQHPSHLTTTKQQYTPSDNTKYDKNFGKLTKYFQIPSRGIPYLSVTAKNNNILPLNKNLNVDTDRSTFLTDVPGTYKNIDVCDRNTIKKTQVNYNVPTVDKIPNTRYLSRDDSPNFFIENKLNVLEPTSTTLVGKRLFESTVEDTSPKQKDYIDCTNNNIRNELLTSLYPPGVISKPFSVEITKPTGPPITNAHKSLDDMNPIYNGHYDSRGGYHSDALPSSQVIQRNNIRNDVCKNENLSGKYNKVPSNLDVARANDIEGAIIYNEQMAESNQDGRLPDKYLFENKINSMKRPYLSAGKTYECKTTPEYSHNYSKPAPVSPGVINFRKNSPHTVPSSNFKSYITTKGIYESPNAFEPVSGNTVQDSSNLFTDQIGSDSSIQMYQHPSHLTTTKQQYTPSDNTKYDKNFGKLTKYFQIPSRGIPYLSVTAKNNNILPLNKNLNVDTDRSTFLTDVPGTYKNIDVCDRNTIKKIQVNYNVPTVDKIPNTRYLSRDDSPNFFIENKLNVLEPTSTTLVGKRLFESTVEDTSPKQKDYIDCTNNNIRNELLTSLYPPGVISKPFSVEITKPTGPPITNAHKSLDDMNPIYNGHYDSRGGYHSDALPSSQVIQRNNIRNDVCKNENLSGKYNKVPSNLDVARANDIEGAIIYNEQMAESNQDGRLPDKYLFENKINSMKRPYLSAGKTYECKTTPEYSHNYSKPAPVSPGVINFRKNSPHTVPSSNFKSYITTKGIYESPNAFEPVSGNTVQDSSNLFTDQIGSDSSIQMYQHPSHLTTTKQQYTPSDNTKYDKNFGKLTKYFQIPSRGIPYLSVTAKNNNILPLNKNLNVDTDRSTFLTDVPGTYKNIDVCDRNTNKKTQVNYNVPTVDKIPNTRYLSRDDSPNFFIENKLNVLEPTSTTLVGKRLFESTVEDTSPKQKDYIDCTNNNIRNELLTSIYRPGVISKLFSKEITKPTGPPITNAHKSLDDMNPIYNGHYDSRGGYHSDALPSSQVIQRNNIRNDVCKNENLSGKYNKVPSNLDVARANDIEGAIIYNEQMAESNQDVRLPDKYLFENKINSMKRPYLSAGKTYECKTTPEYSHNYSKPAPVSPGVIYFRKNPPHTVPSSNFKSYITTKGIYESPNAFEPVSGNTVQDSSNLFTDQIGSDSSIQMYQHPSHLTTTKQQYTPSDNTKYDKNFGKLTKYFQIPSRGIPYLSVTAKNNNILPLNKNLNVDTDRSTFLTDVPGTYKNIDVCDRNTIKKTQVNYNVPTVDKIPNTRYLSRDDSPNFFIENKLNVLEPTSTTLVGKRLFESTVEDTSPKQKDYIDCTNNNIRNELLTSLYPPGVISKPFSVEITKPTGPPITNAHKSLDDMNPIYNGHYDSRGGYHSDALPSSQVIQRNNIRNDVCKNENLSGKYNKVPSNLDVARANDIEGAIIYNEQMAESNQDGRLPDKYLFENKINSMKRPYLSAGKTYECKTTPEYSHNYSKPAPVSPGVIYFRKNPPHTVPSSNFKSYITTKGIYESPNAFEPVSGNTVQDSSNLFTDQIRSDSNVQMYQHPSHLTTMKQQYTPSDNTKYDKNFGKLTKYFQIPSRGIPYLSVTAKNNNILPLNKNLNVDTDRSTFLTDVPGTYKNIDECDRNTNKKTQVNYNVPTVDKIPNTRYLSRDDSPNFFIENKLNVLEPTSTTLVGKRLFESTVEDTSPKQKDYIDCTNNNIRNELLTSLYPPGVISKPFSVEITKPTGPPITNAHKSLDDMNPIYNGHYDSRGGYHSDALPSSQVIQRNNIRNDVCKNENLSGKYNKVPSNLDVARANDIEGAIIYNEQMAESYQDVRLPDKYLFENKINSMKRPYLSAGKTYECKTTPEYSHNYSKPAPVSPGVIYFRKNPPHTVPSSNFKSYITTKGIYESPNAFEPVSGNTVQDSSNLFTDQIGSDSSIQMYQHPSHLTTTKQQYTPSDNTKYDKNFGKLTKYFQIPSRGIPYLSVTAKNNNILPLNKNLNVDTDRSTFLTDVPGTYKNIDECDRNTNKKTQVNYNVPTVDKIPNTRYLSRDDSPNFFIENKLNVLEPTSTTLVGKRLFESTVEDTSPKQKDYIDCTNNNIRNELLTSLYPPGVISKPFSVEITKPTGPPITNAHKSLDDMNPIYNGHYDSRGGYHSDALPSSQVIQRNNIRNDVCKNENLSGKYNKVPSNLDVARANDIEGAIIYNEQMAESNQDGRLSDKYLFENKINSMKRPYLSAGKTYECKTTPEYSHNYSKPAPVSPGVIYFRKNPPHTVPSSNFKSYITTKGIYESPNAFEPVSGNTVQDSSNLFTDQIRSDSNVQMYQHPSHLTTMKQQYTPSDNTKYDKNFGKLTKYFQIPSRGIPYLSVTAKNNNILPLNKNLNVDTDRSTLLTDVPGTYKNIDECDRNTNKKTQVNYNVPTVDKIPNTRYLSRDDSPNFFIENKLNVLEPTSTTLVGKRLFESTVEDTSPKQKDYIDCTNNNIRNELLTSLYPPGVISKPFSVEITKPTGPPITNAHKSLDDMNPIYNGHYDSRGGYHSDALPSSQVIQRNNIRNDVCKNENLSGKYNKVPSNLDVARANDIEGAIIYNEQMAESYQDVRLPDKYLFENKINSMKRPYLSAGKTYECKTTPEYSHNYSKPAPVSPGVIYFRKNPPHTVPSSNFKSYITTKGIYESPNAFEPVSGNTVQDSSNLFTDQIGSDSSIQMYQHPSHLTTTKQQYTPSDNTKYDKNFGKLTKYFQIPSRGIPYLSVTAKNNNILPLNKNLNVDTDRSTFLTDVPGTYKNIDECDRNTNKKTQVNYNVPTVDKIPNTRYLSRDDSPNFFIENKLNVLEPTSTTLVGKRLFESTVEDTSPKQKDYIDCTNNNIRNELLTSLYPPGVISKPFSVEITKPTGPPITNAHKSLDDMNPIYNGHYDSRGGYHSDALPSSQVIQRNNIRNDVCKNENLSGKYKKVPSNLDVARANNIEGAIIYNEQMAESNQDGRLSDKYLFENKINSMKRPYLSAGKTYECKTTPEYSHNYSKPAPVSPGVIYFRKNPPHTVPSSNFKSYITTKGIYESPNAFEPVSGNTVQDSSNLFTDQIRSDSNVQMYQHPSHLTTMKQQYTPSDNTKYDKNFGKLTKYFQIPSRGIPYLSVTAKNNNILPLNKNLNVDTDRSTFLTDVPGTYKNIDECDRNTNKKTQVNYNVPTVDKIPNTRYLSRDDSPNFFIENKLNVLEPTSTTLVGKRLFESTVEDTSPKQKDYIDCTNNNIRNELLTSLYPPGVISKPFSVEITKPTGPPITNAHKSLDDMNPIYNGHYDSRGGYHSDALPSSQVIQRNNIRNDVCKNENLSGKYNKVPSNLDVARANDIEGAIIYNEQMAESYQDVRLPDKYLFENKINSMKRPYLSAGKTYECKTTPEYSHNYSKPAPVSPGVIYFRKNPPHTVPSSNFKSYITTKGIYESPNAFEPVSGNTVQDSSNLFTDQIGSDSSIQMYQHPSHLTTTKQQYTPSDNTKYDKNFGKLTKYFQIPSRGIPYLSVTAKNNNILPLNKNLNVDTDRSTFLTDVPGTYKNIDECDRNTNKKTQVNYNVPTVDKIPNTRYLSRDDSPNFFIENKLNVLEPTSTTLVGKRLFESTVEDTSPKQKDYIDCTNNNIRNELLTSIYPPGVISKPFSVEITKPTGPPITNAHKSLDYMNPIYNGHYDSRGGYHSDALPSSQVIQRNNIRNDVCKNENLSGKYKKVPSNLDVARANNIEGAIIYNEQMAESNQDVRLPDKYLFENKINSMKRPYLSAGKTYECKTTPECSHNFSKTAPVSCGVIYYRTNSPHPLRSSKFNNT